MTVKRSKKGQMRVIEAILASFVLIFALTFVNFFNVNTSSEKYEITDMNKMGYNILHDLDVQGLLAKYIYAGDWSNLRDAISVTLPVDVYFNITVLYLDYTPRTNSSMYYGKIDVLSNSEIISSVTYPVIGCANITTGFDFGAEANYDPSIVVLQLARG